jgi:hypothetical protein
MRLHKRHTSPAPKLIRLRPITTVETTGPDVITDLPCLEGKEFLATGKVTAKIRFVQDEKGVHFVFWARNEGTLVPVDAVRGRRMSRVGTSIVECKT